MICGVKWKGCDCPWFNYQTVERERIVHAQGFPPEGGGRRGEVDAEHLRARGYQAELDARREQERRDEAFARQLQGLAVGGIGMRGSGGAGAGVEIYQVYSDDDEDFGNGHNHTIHPNHIPPPLIFDRPPQPDIHACPPLNQPSVLRRHSQGSRAYNRNLSGARAAERVVPTRQDRGYEREREIFAPVGGMGGMGGIPQQPTGSALAGLTRGGTAEGRVEEWRRWVGVG